MQLSSKLHVFTKLHSGELYKVEKRMGKNANKKHFLSLPNHVKNNNLGSYTVPCLDSTVMGIPGSLSFMKGPYSLSIPSLANSIFLVHTFPCTRSLSSCIQQKSYSTFKDVAVFCNSICLCSQNTGCKIFKVVTWAKKVRENSLGACARDVSFALINHLPPRFQCTLQKWMSIKLCLLHEAHKNWLDQGHKSMRAMELALDLSLKMLSSTLEALEIH